MLNCYVPRVQHTDRRTAVESEDEESQDRKPGSNASVANGGTPSSRSQASRGTRADRRGDFDLRQVYMDVGVVAHATGSAYVEFNHTKVICTVHGPRAQSGKDSVFSEEGQLQCEFSYAPFALSTGRREAKGGRRDDEREFSSLLRQTLVASVQVGLLTKSVVDIHALVLQADGGELAVATTCASLALADAGVELYDLVAACSAGYRGTQIVLDPTGDEEITGKASMAVALMPTSQRITQWWQEGRFDGQHITEALELCLDGCACIHKMMETRLCKSARENMDPK